MNEHSNNDFQDREIRLKPLTIFLVGTLVVTALAVVGMKALFDVYTRDAKVNVVALSERMMSADRPTNAVLQGAAEAAIHLQQVRDDADGRLNHYRLIDEDAGIVQIPVARAMEVMLEQERFAVRSEP